MSRVVRRSEHRVSADCEAFRASMGIRLTSLDAMLGVCGQQKEMWFKEGGSPQGRGEKRADGCYVWILIQVVNIDFGVLVVVVFGGGGDDGLDFCVAASTGLFRSAESKFDVFCNAARAKVYGFDVCDACR